MLAKQELLGFYQYPLPYLQIQDLILPQDFCVCTTVEFTELSSCPIDQETGKNKLLPVQNINFNVQVDKQAETVG